MKKLILLFIILVAGLKLTYGQDEAIFSHYYLNPVIVNPAAAGFNDQHTILFNARAQWTGFPDAPKTVSALYHGSIGPIFGVGARAVTETMGELTRIKGELNFAFRFPLGADEDIMLATGIAAKVQQTRLSDDFMGSNIFDPDQFLMEATNGENVFDAGLGVHATFSERTFVGLSFSNLVQTRLDGIVTDTEQQSLFQYYVFYAGHEFDLVPNQFTLEPSMMLRQIQDAPFQVDLNMKAGFFLNNGQQLLAGLSYRSLGAVGVLLGTDLSNFQVYYSYDTSFQNFQQYNGGSHEVTVAILFSNDQRKRPYGR